MNTRLLFYLLVMQTGFQGRYQKRNWQPDGFDLLGNVTMDQIMIGPIEDDRPIELIPGKAGEVEKWAQCAGTTSYEILTGFGSRIRRVLN